MPNGAYGYAYAPSGLSYIPDIGLPQQLQPSLPQLQLPTYYPSYTTPSGLSYIPDIELPPQLQPITPSGLTYIPDIELPPQLQPPVAEQPVGYGPVELAGDVLKGAWDLLTGAAKTLADAAKFILENLEVGVGMAGQVGGGIGGISAQQKQAEAQKLAAEAQKIAAEAYKIQALASQMAGIAPGDLRNFWDIQDQPLYIEPPAPIPEPRNYLLYIAIGIGFLLYTGKIKL